MCSQMMCIEKCIVTLVAFVWLFLHCALSNVSSNCLPEKMQSHIGCICLAFLHLCFIFEPVITLFTQIIFRNESKSCHRWTIVAWWRPIVGTCPSHVSHQSFLGFFLHFFSFWRKSLFHDTKVLWSPENPPKNSFACSRFSLIVSLCSDIFLSHVLVSLFVFILQLLMILWWVFGWLSLRLLMGWDGIDCRVLDSTPLKKLFKGPPPS